MLLCVEIWARPKITRTSDITGYICVINMATDSVISFELMQDLNPTLPGKMAALKLSENGQHHPA